jgi:S-adenosylmethionine synthetase
MNTSDSLNSSLGGSTPRLLVAEAVLPGHPDKLADQIADAVLDVALSKDERAIVQLEVAVDREICFVNGRCSTAGGPLPRELVEDAIRAVYGRAGYGVPFTGVGGTDATQGPKGEDVDLLLRAAIDEADIDERAQREHADDQAIHIGYAVATPETRFLPLEQHVALALRDRLVELCATRREIGCGPDGKLLVVLAPSSAGSGRGPAFAVREVIVSLQHLQAAPPISVERAVRDCLLSELAELHTAMPDLLAEPDAGVSLRFNPSGVFVVGGPMNDNGQTGRKLVCDFYGPRVPIGGGALSGKDPWRLDRVGAFRARQLALAIVDTGFVQDALVTFAWAPRDLRPSHVEIVVDGRMLSAHDVGRWTQRYDPALGAAWEELELAGVNYERCARVGHFGREVPWEAVASAAAGSMASPAGEVPSRLAAAAR